jgi:ubiquinone/menaquinone biosynthesis C-methylase UbiE
MMLSTSFFCLDILRREYFLLCLSYESEIIVIKEVHKEYKYMTAHQEPRREHPSTYVVQDRSNEEEMNRLRIQAQMLNASMGGVLPEQPQPDLFRHVLDVGCGPGIWVIEAAQKYPDMSLTGIDISRRMLEFARMQAVAQGVADRVEFHMMDALRMLEFPANSFDLVNLRSSISWMRKWDWPKLISEFLRVTRSGGVVRVTESDVPQASNKSPMFNRWFEMGLCGLFRAGNFFEQESTGLSAHIAPLLHQHGVRDVQTHLYTLEYHGGTPQGQAFSEDWARAFRTHRPFLQKWGCMSKDYDAVCQQAAEEMKQSDFHVTWNFLTAWGISP